MSDTRVVLLGVGSIGRELLRQLAANRRASARTIRICGLIDRSGFVFDPDGLEWRRVLELRAHKVAGRPLAEAEGGRAATAHEAIGLVTATRDSRVVLIDATAADTRSLLETALASRWDIVLANKIPLAGEQADYDQLHKVARLHKRRILHEATVGAGLPVIDTLHKLLDAGDRVFEIEGCPSGTLGYLFGELGRGQRFSDALRAAMAAGYTEPDPRIDLSGLDVARKALILARLLGFRGDLSSVAVESLVSPALTGVNTEEFVARIGADDVAWDSRVATARRRGCVLRYRARVTRQKITIGLAEVPAASALGSLSGTDNQFSFTTARYRLQPLVITGPGAGPAVTAAGVYNDLLSISARRAARSRGGSLSASARSARALPV